jgi:hypothetical protein
MDLESATLAMIVNVVCHQQRSQQRSQHPATTRIKRKSIRTAPAYNPAPFAVRTPILAPASAARPARPSSRELDAISKIRKGEGVSPYVIQGLLEQCGICKMYFTGTVLCRHIFECSHSL